MELTCDMTHDCKAPIAMIDDKGYIYCDVHGQRRRDTRPCRKLTKVELRTLQDGRPIARY